MLLELSSLDYMLLKGRELYRTAHLPLLVRYRLGTIALDAPNQGVRIRPETKTKRWREH